MIKILFTTEHLPQGFMIKDTFQMIQITGIIKIIDSELENFDVNYQYQYQAIINSFIEHAPKKSNAIIGVTISTSIQRLGHETQLFITYIGCPAIVQVEEM